jgi:type II secretory pathway pseudopilin PulG
LTEHYRVTLSDTQQQIERLAGRVLDRPVRDALIALLPIFQLKEVQDMATIQEALADLDAAVQGVAQRTAADHADLQSQIDELKAQGVDTAALQDAANKIEQRVSDLNAISVPVPTDPTAPVEEPTTPTDGGTTTPPVETPTDPAPPVDTPTDPAPPVDEPVDTTPPADPTDPTTTAPVDTPTDPIAPVDPTVPADGGDSSAPAAG